MRILVVEDERRLSDALVQILTEVKYQAEAVYNGDDGLSYALSGLYDVVVLDVMMPGIDGFEVVRQLRREHCAVPVLMLTAKSELIDKVHGLDMGTDDYMTKPFNILEVKARIKTILRRAGAGKEAPKMEITAGDITININTRSVISHGEPVNLTVKEFDLLNLFMSNIGKIYSRDELLETIWGFDYIGDFRTVDVHIRRLREKIEKDPANPKHIMTKWGVGYYFAE